MKLFQILMITDRSITIELNNDSPYYTFTPVEIWDKEDLVYKGRKNVFSIYDLESDRKYSWKIKVEEIEEKFTFQTKKYNYIFDVSSLKDKRDSTTELQMIINTLPKNSLIEFGEGEYYFKTLFLRENIDIFIHKNAILHGIGTRDNLSVLPIGYGEENFYPISTWEGESNESFCALINIIGQKQLTIFGEGTIDGGVNYENWWSNSKVKGKAFRPRLLSIIQSSEINILDITLKNSPSWTIHPLCSQNLNFIHLNIINPKTSPNTDGINPEFCNNVFIKGVYISVGDDCIAIKSGKLSLAQRIKKTTANIIIENCKMENGHGGVVLGSEMSGGIQNILVKKCIFSFTDRGIRIKTRRGRGKYGIIDKVIVDNIYMNQVGTAIVINSFYFCDADGKSAYVQNRAAQEVDEKTPSIKTIALSRLICKNIQICGIFVMGLPEKPVEEVSVCNSEFSFSNEEVYDYPAMLCHQDKITKTAIIVQNVKNFILKDTDFFNYKGRFASMENVENYIQDNKGE